MLHFGVNIPATVPQKSEIPEGLMNYPVYKVLQFACTKLSENWKNECIKLLNILRKVEGIKMLQLFKIFIQNVKFYGENHCFQIFLPLSWYQ
jgi:hypothetical protein